MAREVPMLVELLVATVPLVSPVANHASGVSAAAPPGPPASQTPYVALFTGDRDFFTSGDRVQVSFRSATDGYVMVFRVDTDGRIRVLFPRRPGDENHVRAGQTHVLRDPHDPSAKGAFVVDEYPGVGYLFAIVSLDRFDYGSWARGGRWNYNKVAPRGRVSGDPYVTLADLEQHLLPPGYRTYAHDVLPYLVAGSPAAYSEHRDWCGTFRVVYDDPTAYPVFAPPLFGPPAVYAAHPAPLYGPPTYVYTLPRGLHPRVPRTPRRSAATPVGRPAAHGATRRTGMAGIPSAVGRRPAPSPDVAKEARRRVGEGNARRPGRAPGARSAPPEMRQPSSRSRTGHSYAVRGLH